MIRFPGQGDEDDGADGEDEVDCKVAACRAYSREKGGECTDGADEVDHEVVARGV